MNNVEEKYCDICKKITIWMYGCCFEHMYYEEIDMDVALELKKSLELEE